MKIDFTLRVYKKLLNQIIESGYHFQTIEDFYLSPKSKVVVLRHDSDAFPKRDLDLAQIENNLNVSATYYYRIPETFNINVIKKIIELNHEVGYHYEDLVRSNGNFNTAMLSFVKNLNKLRSLYNVKSISRHGRPLSNIESLDLWKKHAYKKHGVICEAYLDIDYTNILYLTDTGRMWNAKSNVRDRVKSNFSRKDIKSTHDLINAFKNGSLPDKIIINTHPLRWTEKPPVWFYNYLSQSFKNILKNILKKIRN
tara:strand:- start:116 stop:877 length:762 start_codon:yes stop_codon:yes gene_type:complete